MTRLLTKTFRPFTATRAFTTAPPRYFPANPKPSDPAATSGGMSDQATVPKDKQGEVPGQSQPGGAAGAPSPGGSGGPTEQTGMADPGIPEKDAKNAKEGMTKTDGGNSPARN